MVETPKGPEPFDLSAASVVELLQTEAPTREWLVHERLPLGVVGLLAAAGATGKSMLTLQLAIACCTGMPWLGMAQGRSGSVLMLSTEDDRDEIHRRLRIAMSHYRMLAGDRADAIEELVGERLFILDRVGDDNRLTMQLDRELVATAMAERVIRTAEQMHGPVLIVLDPLSRFDGGDGNDNGDGTRLIEAAERIRKGTGCTVLLPHHVSKAGIRDPESGQEAVRGASGLVDGARWVGLLATLRREDANKYGVEPEEAGHYVRFTTPKANYSAPWPGMWLEKQAGGVLVPTELRERQTQGGKAGRSDTDFAELAERIANLIRRKGPMPKRRIEDDFGGTTNVLKAGQKAVRGAIVRALEEGVLVTTCPEGGREVIALPTGDDGQSEARA
ncbi:AAA family ATPase [Algiphilus sp.]|uniref:AAA family ATPase n=1 Tax=Algiphilus sp. TaxID=1872431 RepID=UPI0032F03232